MLTDAELADLFRPPPDATAILDAKLGQGRYTISYQYVAYARGQGHADVPLAIISLIDRPHLRASLAFDHCPRGPSKAVAQEWMSFAERLEPARGSDVPPGILVHFDVSHLPAAQQLVAGPFHELARRLARGPRCAEQAVALRKLLEAMDAALRASREVPESLSGYPDT